MPPITLPFTDTQPNQVAVQMPPAHPSPDPRPSRLWCSSHTPGSRAVPADTPRGLRTAHYARCLRVPLSLYGRLYGLAPRIIYRCDYKIMFAHISTRSRYAFLGVLNIPGWASLKAWLGTIAFPIPRGLGRRDPPP